MIPFFGSRSQAVDSERLYPQIDTFHRKFAQTIKSKINQHIYEIVHYYHSKIISGDNGSLFDTMVKRHFSSD